MTPYEELLASGARAAGHGCSSVLIAPDHTGELNYHNCDHGKGSKPHTVRSHTCGCGYTWTNHGRNAQIETHPVGAVTWHVKRDGKTLAMLGTANDAERWLQRHQPMSNDWAKRYEGYAITEVNNNA